MSLHTLTLRGPADIAAALPSLLGFHPTHSVVLIAFHQQRIVLTMRVDLPDSPDDGWAHDVVHRTTRVPADAVIFIVADDTFHPGRENGAAAFGEDAIAALMRVPSEREVLDALMVGGGRWRSYLCDGACCPSDGTPILQQDIDRIRCAMSLGGNVVAEDREAIRAEFASIDPIPIHRFPRPQIDDAWVATQRKGLLATLRQLSTADMRTEPKLTDDVLLFIAALHTPRIRDAMMWHVSGEDESTQKVLLRSLASLMRRTPDGLVDGIAVLAGILGWLIGDGARGADACERALHANPECVLAELLLAAMASGLPPAMWRDGIANVSQEDCWAGRMGTAA